MIFGLWLQDPNCILLSHLPKKTLLLQSNYPKYEPPQNPLHQQENRCGITWCLLEHFPAVSCQREPLHPAQ